MVSSIYMNGQEFRAGSKDSAAWPRVRAILGACLELSPAARSAYLDEACGGDAHLRTDVESLLEASEGPSFLDHPDPESSTTTVEVSAFDAGLKPGWKIGHYVVTGKIGEGGMGAVYKATDELLNRSVALKVISELYGTPAQRRRFSQEARAASALNHPNIVTIYEYNSQRGMDFLVMEYVDGKTLDRILKEKQASLRALIGYAAQVAGALAAAHQAGIVHRDLKPGNIMVTGNGEAVKVLDFGLAKHLEHDSGDPDNLTRTGHTVGTPACMSPEQVRGEPADHRSDIFSLGVILYEMVCGRKPFDGADATEMLYRIVHKGPVPVEKLNTRVPGALAALIDRCLRKTKEERVQSMAEIRSELLRVIDSLANVPLESARKPRNLGLAAAGVALVLLVGAGGFLWRARNSHDRTITYWLEAQKPGGNPYAASESETFHAGEKFRLHLKSPLSGYIYLIDEGPGANGAPRFFVLYPRGAASAALDANRELVTGWNVFDENAGAEELWIVFADKPVAPLQEDLSDSGAGDVKDPRQAANTGGFLSRLGRPSRTAEPGSGVQLRAAEGVLGGVVELRHE